MYVKQDISRDGNIYRIIRIQDISRDGNIYRIIRIDRIKLVLECAYNTKSIKNV